MSKFNRIHLPFEKREIPYLDDILYIDINDDNNIIVIDEDENEIKPINGLYKLPFSIGEKEVSINFLIAFTYIPIYKANEKVFNWLVLTIDDTRPLHPNNLIWKSKLEDLEDPLNPGFYIIPRYTRYCINQEGTIKRRYSPVVYGKIAKDLSMLSESEREERIRIVAVRKMEPSKENTYLQATLLNDAQKDDSTPIHRLLGYVFLEYGNNLTSLTINHKNGLQYDNRIENIEWISASKNNVHAKDEGLNTARMPIVVIDLLKNCAFKFKSISDAVLYTKSFFHVIHKLIDTNVSYRNYFYKTYVKDCDVYSIGEYKFELKDIDPLENRKCFAKNIRTNIIILAKNYVELSEMVKYTSNYVLNAISSVSNYIRGGYIFGFVDELKDKNITLSKDQIDFYDKKDKQKSDRNKNLNVIRTPIKITNIQTKESVYYSNFQKASTEFFNKNRGYIKDYFNSRGNPKTVEIKNYLVEKLNSKSDTQE